MPPRIPLFLLPLTIPLALLAGFPARADPGVDRCLERLERGGDADEHFAACATLLGTTTPFFDPAPEGGDRACHSNELALPTARYRASGYWLDGSPARWAPPRHYEASQLAIASKGCETFRVKQIPVPGWKEARERCAKTGYDTVHLYLSTSSRDFVKRYNDQLPAFDPWLKDPKTRGRVVSFDSEDILDIRSRVARLMMDCKVVDHLVLNSHARPGRIGFGPPSDQAILLEFDHVLERVLSPCLLAPAAKIQATGCRLACSSSAGQLRRDLKRHLTNPSYATPEQPHPFEGVQLLANTDDSRFKTAPRLLKPPSFSVPNGLGLLYEVKGGDVVMDVTGEDIPDCPKSKKDKAKGEERE